MNANWFGILCAVVSVSIFFFSYRFLLSKNSMTRIALALSAAVLSIPGLSFAVYYLHWFPEPDWYYEFRSWRGIELVLAPLGLFGGAIGTFFPGAFRMLPLGGVIALAFVPFLKPILGPLDLEQLEDIQKDGTTLQSLPSTCGAASSSTILRLFGFDVSEAEVARRAYSYVNGTEAWYLARVLRSYGVAVRFRDDFKWEKADKLPVIAGVKIAGVGHFVPILDREGTALVIADPLRGKEVLEPHVLEGRYTFFSWAMEITPTHRKVTSFSMLGCRLRWTGQATAAFSMARRCG